VNRFQISDWSRTNALRQRRPATITYSKIMRRLTTVSNSIEATFLQHALEMEGINSFITNEHTSTMLPHFYGMLGHGIQIMVSETDYEKAKEILAVRQNENQIRTCPNCGSSNIGFGMRGKKRLGVRLLIFLSLFVVVPMGNIKNKYYCKDCGEDFE
jgi:Protein of unknown function (DUF2007).